VQIIPVEAMYPIVVSSKGGLIAMKHYHMRFSRQIARVLDGRRGTLAGRPAAVRVGVKTGWIAICAVLVMPQGARRLSRHFSIHIERGQLVRLETLVNSFSCLHLRFPEN
jgi:hypothetical protein